MVSGEGACQQEGEERGDDAEKRTHGLAPVTDSVTSSATSDSFVTLAVRRSARYSNTAALKASLSSPATMCVACGRCTWRACGASNLNSSTVFSDTRSLRPP